MPTFIALIDFTRQGLQSIQESPKRAATITRQAEAAGLSVKDVYWTAGPHDGLLVLDAPDDTAASAFLLSVARMGNVRTTMMRAFDRSEFEAVVAKMG